MIENASSKEEAAVVAANYVLNKLICIPTEYEFSTNIDALSAELVENFSIDFEGFAEIVSLILEGLDLQVDLKNERHKLALGNSYVKDMEVSWRAALWAKFPLGETKTLTVEGKPWISVTVDSLSATET